jgi:molybdopterin converting factor small subunit
VLVIRGDSLVTHDQVVADDDTIELRPVMSGGST